MWERYDYGWSADLEMSQKPLFGAAALIELEHIGGRWVFGHPGGRLRAFGA
jgi:hypothetical protein